MVWGGATPLDNPDHGVGVALFDFEANYAFEQQHNDNAADLELERGRFAVVFGAGPDEDDPNAELGFVIAAFRDFVPADEPQAAPVSLDYLYGRYADADNSIDFINWRAPIDHRRSRRRHRRGPRRAHGLHQRGHRPRRSHRHRRLAGHRRDRDRHECWDTSINQTYLGINGIDDVGVQADCGLLFNAELSALSIPTLSDLDADLVAELDAVATNGIPNE